MQTQNLVYFITAAEELNFTRASAKLFITQQSLSEQIKKLEEKYGAVFFERKPKLRLTRQGERFLEYARQVVAAEQSLISDLKKESETSVLKIGNASTRGRRVIQAAMRQFIKLFPNISYSLINSDYNSLLRMLEAGEIDVMTASFSPDESEYNTDVIYHSDFIYVCSKTLLNNFCTEEHFAGCEEEEQKKNKG